MGLDTQHPTASVAPNLRVAEMGISAKNPGQVAKSSLDLEYGAKNNNESRFVKDSSTKRGKLFLLHNIQIGAN